MTPPLAIICLDAMDFGLLQQWVASGDLPHLKAFLANASAAKTHGPELRVEASVWASIWTGLPPEEHGFYYFQQLVPGTYRLEPMSGRTLKALPFWSHLQGTGKRCLIADAPEISDVSGLPGLQLLDYAVHSPWKSPMSVPGTLLAEVRKRHGRDWSIAENPDATVAEDLRFFKRFRERLAMKSKLYEDLLSRGPFDLMVLGFGEIHTGAHQFWKYLQEPGYTSLPVRHEVLSDALRTLYRDTDAAFGRLMTQLPKDCTVMIMSSVGLREAWPIDGLSQALMRLLGYDVAPIAGGSKSFDPMSVARKMIPESARIALSKIIHSREQRDRIVADQFTQGKDWARTRAFAIPSFYDTQIRVNLRGREPNGIVEPGEERRRLLDEIEAELRALRDPETGEPVIWDVVNRGRDGVAPQVLPDLEAYWTPSADWRRSVRHPKGVLTQTRPAFCRGSHHSRTGFVALRGARFESDSLAVLDLAPTYLALMGLEKPAAMQGESRLRH